MIRTLIITTALVLAIPAVAQETPAPATAPAPMSVTDPADFAAKASISNLFELETSTLALERAVGQDTKAFAQQMITDHTKAAQDMAPAAEEEGVALENALDSRHQEMLDALGDSEGEEFDKAYIEAQAKAHDEAVALFEGYSTNGEEGPLKAFASATLPVLKSHQEHVHGVTGH
jgi:putative membrane protein